MFLQKAKTRFWLNLVLTGFMAVPTRHYRLSVVHSAGDRADPNLWRSVKGGCGEQIRTGGASSPRAEPPAWLQPSPLGLAEMPWGDKAPMSRHFFEFTAFWGLPCNIRGGVKMTLCPLAVTFIPRISQPFPVTSEGTPPEVSAGLPPSGEEMPLACVSATSEGRNSLLFPLLFPAVNQGCMVTIRRPEGFGVVWMFAHPWQSDLSAPMCSLAFVHGN